jgi:hypothetical protein
MPLPESEIDGKTAEFTPTRDGITIPVIAMERGELTTLIENNRGHCTRIVEYYGRVGGVRDWLVPRLAKDKLKP